MKALAQSDESIIRRDAVRGSQRLLESLRLHHGSEEERSAAMPPEETPEPGVLPPIPNTAIATACLIAFPPDGARFLNQVEIIQRAVLREFPKVTMADLKSPRRTGLIVRARQIGMYLAKTITTKSFPDIGRRFGGRDHTTVIHAVRKIEAAVPKDGELAAQIARIKENLPEIRI